MRKFSIAALLLGSLSLAISARPAAAQVNVSVSIGGFYDELAPYGRWVDCRYGQCWAPSGIDRGWQPYSNGQWIYTEYGWTWVSDDPWGGNPYHYGTWTLLDQYGWCWVPGTVWAPAWVTWNYSDRYVGWAPLPPTVAFGSSGYLGRAISVRPAYYVFVPSNRFVGTSVSSNRISTQQNSTIFRQTKPVTRFTVSGGYVRNMALPLATVQRAAGGRIETRSIGDARATPRSMTAGKNQRLAIIAPAREVTAAVADRKHAGPSSPASSGQKKEVKTQSREERKRPMTETRQESARERSAPAKPRQKEQKAPRADQPSSEKPHGQSGQSTAPPRHESSKPPARAETRPAEPRGNAAPPQHPQQPPARTEAAPQTHHDQGQAASHAQPRQNPKGNKPAEKNKGQKEKDGKDKGEEKH